MLKTEKKVLHFAAMYGLLQRFPNWAPQDFGGGGA